MFGWAVADESKLTIVFGGVEEVVAGLEGLEARRPKRDFKRALGSLIRHSLRTQVESVEVNRGHDLRTSRGFRVKAWEWHIRKSIGIYE